MLWVASQNAETTVPTLKAWIVWNPQPEAFIVGMMFSAVCFIGLAVRLIWISTFPERKTDLADIVNFGRCDELLIVPELSRDTADILLTTWFLRKGTAKCQMKVKLREEVLIFVLVIFQSGIV